MTRSWRGGLSTNHEPGNSELLQFAVVPELIASPNQVDCERLCLCEKSADGGLTLLLRLCYNSTAFAGCAK